MNPIIYCPLFVMVSSRKKFILNLNNYRNLNRFSLNKAKKAYFQDVKYQVSKLPIWQRVAVKFTMYPRDNRTIDTSNVCSIHDKFLMDVIVTMGKLPDDDYHHDIKKVYLFGCVDRQNPRVEAEFFNMGKLKRGNK